MTGSGGNGTALPPPRQVVGPVAWVRDNLFSSPLNSALTIMGVAFLGIVFPPLFRWLVIDAAWSGATREACGEGGACWVFVKVRLNQFLYGFYPVAEQWRINTVVVLLAALLGYFASGLARGRTYVNIVVLAGFPFIAFVLLAGGLLGLPPVETARWGGLMLTLTIAVVGIAASLPFGVMLALGRRSRLPVIRYLSIGFIEFWRGVPLITVLFMASVMLPLFLPEDVNFDKLLRAVIGVVLFQSAYMAEVVRGGLQAIPRGQFEASQALGLGFWKTMGLVVMPQALKLVIPGIVNTFIALFKDTALVLIIGLFDLLGIVQAAFTDPAWIGFTAEGYIFAGFVYWIFCFSMSRYSQRLERTLSTGR